MVFETCLGSSLLQRLPKNENADTEFANRFEYFTSLIKIVLFMLIIVLSLAIVCGAGPKGYVHDGATWRDLPAFKNGFSVRTA